MKTIIKASIFPAKILLFGEYSILMGGDALALPYPYKFAIWDQGNIPEGGSLMSLYKYLVKNRVNFLDLEKFHTDISAGYYLKSNIEFGKGLGSSASVTAAVYDRYSIDNPIDLAILKSRFSVIESFFHGKSSGFDPLVAYTKKVVYNQAGRIKTIDFSSANMDHFFLLDSGINRSNNTVIQKVINLFNSNSKLKSNYITAQNAAIESFLSSKQLREKVKIISKLQFNHLKTLIPKNLLNLWKAGLKDDSYFIKLCGGGGGGYFLGYDSSEGKQMKDLPFSIFKINQSSDLY